MRPTEQDQRPLVPIVEPDEPADPFLLGADDDFEQALNDVLSTDGSWAYDDLSAEYRTNLLHATNSLRRMVQRVSKGVHVGSYNETWGLDYMGRATYLLEALWHEAENALPRFDSETD